MIVKPRPDGLFDIELPEGATNEQNTLKSKIEALLALLKQKQSDPDFAHWIAILQLIAERGFAGDPVAASEQVDLFAAAVTRPKPPPRPGAFEVHLPDPEDPNDKVISWREIIFEVRGDLVPVPPEQLKLKADIESTLTTIQAIFPDRDGELHPKKLTPE